MDESGFSHLSLVKYLDIEVCPDALIVYFVYQGYLVGSLHHEGSLGLDIKGEGFHDMRVMKADCEVRETVEMNWSTTKTGLNGSYKTIIKSDVMCVSKGHQG